MSLMTYDLSDELQMTVRMMGDGRLTLTVWDDRLEERRCCLEWDEVKHLMRTLKACEQAIREDVE
jgi:hypothetical protein